MQFDFSAQKNPHVIKVTLRRKFKWIMPDLNRRPPTCEAGALPTELMTQTMYNDTTFGKIYNITLIIWDIKK